MKKILFATASILFATVSFSQSTVAKKLNPGGLYLKGGVNFANISTSSSGTVDEANMLTAFHVGIVGDIPLATAFSFQPGILLNSKGSKTEIYANNSNTSDNYYKLKTNPLYIEIPANFVFKVPFTSESRLFFGAGPYAAMGIGGKTSGERKALGITSSYERNIEFNNDDPFTAGQEDASVNKLRRFDYGFNGLAGFEVGKMSLGVGYGLGLAKINSAENNNADDANKHRVWSLSLGIKL
jgi:hypothetical protein